MNNFLFHNPTCIDFGQDRQHAIGQHFADHNIKHVLICYGSNRVKDNGLFEQVIASLEKQNITYVEFGGIISNPVLSKVHEGIVLAKAEQVDAVLSVGGGSVLDSVKAIAAGAKYDGDVWDLFIGKSKFSVALPIFSILTLAATGSEMNKGAVVTNEMTKEKLGLNGRCLYPTLSIVNPELMKTVTRDYLVYSATDIIAHSIEGYLSAEQQPGVTRRIVEGIIKTVVTTTEQLLENADDYAARAEFAWASTLALNGVSSVGTVGCNYPNHTIEHAISAEFPVPHGAGLSVVMPAWMKWYYQRNEKHFAHLGKEIFGTQTALEGIQALEAWFDKIGTPTRLSQLGLDETSFDVLADSIVRHANRFGNSHIYTRDVALEILNLAK
jgi:NADP-dependent alcohol dehydrogenase